MIDEEIRDCLRELVAETGAVSAKIVTDENAQSGVPARTLALGGGEYLRVELPTRTEREGLEHDIEAAFDRATRQLRGIRRRWEVSNLPEISVSPNLPPAGDLVKRRIHSYLVALAGIDRGTNAFCMRGPTLVAAATPPGELEATRWPFLARRVMQTHAPGSSHGEIVDPDAYAMSFWYDAALVVLLDEPYAVDFVRHRCRQVARELSNLLPMLDPDPGGSAAVRRRPPTIP